MIALPSGQVLSAKIISSTGEAVFSHQDGARWECSINVSEGEEYSLEICLADGRTLCGTTLAQKKVQWVEVYQVLQDGERRRSSFISGGDLALHDSFTLLSGKKLGDLPCFDYLGSLDWSGETLGRVREFTTMPAFSMTIRSERWYHVKTDPPASISGYWGDFDMEEAEKTGRIDFLTEEHYVSEDLDQTLKYFFEQKMTSRVDLTGSAIRWNSAMPSNINGGGGIFGYDSICSEEEQLDLPSSMAT